MKKSRTGIIKMLAVMLMSLVVVCSMAVSAFAAGLGDGLTTLTQGVYDKISGNSYEVSGGGSISGGELMSKNKDWGSSTNLKGCDVDEGQFAKLTSASQTQFVSDIAKYSQEVQEEKDEVSEETVQSWWKSLQAKDGMGSKFLNVILENTKPDFVTANNIYKPFSGIVGTILGLIAVVGMGLLGIVMVSDIFYITLPPVQMLASESEGADGKKRTGVSKIFSHDAMYAVRVANEDDGGKKQALGIYLKRRIPMLILLGICLMYLVSGSIYTFVGWVLDLVSGFLGF